MSDNFIINNELDLSPESIWIIDAPTLRAKSSFVYLQECGDFLSNSRHYTRRKRGLQSYLIEYTLSGEGTLEYEGEIYTLRPGNFFWIDCYESHCYYTNPDAGCWHTLWVHFYGGNSEQYYNHFVSLNNGKHIYEQDNNIQISSLIRELIRIYTKQEINASDRIYASGIITMTMAECIQALNNENLTEPMPECIKDALHYIADNYTREITLDHLAGRYNINKFYFQKLFKRYTNTTPNQYLITNRLSAAKELLRTTSLTINEISYEVGIPSVNHFINLFKRQEGLTPQAFRDMWYNNQG